MSEAKHTPGPWLVRNDGVTKPPEIWTAKGMLICRIAGQAPFDYRNATLVAAAPELLEGLKYLSAEVAGMIGIEEQAFRDLLGNTNVNCLKQRWLNAREAIAKAEGR